MNITKNLKVFFDLMYERNLIQTISKPTRVGKKSTTTIDNIITDYASTCNFYRSYSKKKKKKNDGPSQQRSKTRYLYKSDYNEKNIKAFNHRLLTIN